MTVPVPKRRMTADEFIAWAMQQPEGERHELVAGEVVGMSPERVRHNERKGDVYVALRRAIAERGLTCRAFTDGLSIRIDDSTVYEPDAFVRCGEPLDGDAVEVSDPMVVVEVASPSSQAVDTAAKLDDYFRLPSVKHYLVLSTRSRAVIHHARAEGDRIETRIVRFGPLHLDPPGLTVEVESFFES
jgi:Uma2 family endonuclease